MKFNIGTRLFLGFAVVLAMIVTLGIWTNISGNQTRNFVAEADHASSIVERLLRAQLQARAGRMNTYIYLATGDETAIVKAEQAFAAAFEFYNEVEKLVSTPADRQRLDEVKAATAHLEAKSKLPIQLKQRNTPPNSPEYAAALSEFLRGGQNQWRDD